MVFGVIVLFQRGKEKILVKRHPNINHIIMRCNHLLDISMTCKD